MFSMMFETIMNFTDWAQKRLNETDIRPTVFWSFLRILGKFLISASRCDLPAERSVPVDEILLRRQGCSTENDSWDPGQTNPRR